MLENISPSAILGALPALAALINALWPAESRQRAVHRTQKTLSILEKMDDGPGRTALAKAADEMAGQVASIELRRLGKRLDGGSVATVVFLVVVALGLTWIGSAVDNTVLWVVVALVDVFIALLLFVGSKQIWVYDKPLPSERDANPDS